MTRTDARQMSGPVPSPSMNGTMGRSGTCSLASAMAILSPEGTLLILYGMTLPEENERLRRSGGMLPNIRITSAKGRRREHRQSHYATGKFYRFSLFSRFPLWHFAQRLE